MKKKLLLLVGLIAANTTWAISSCVTNFTVSFYPSNMGHQVGVSYSAPPGCYTVQQDEYGWGIFTGLCLLNSDPYPFGCDNCLVYMYYRYYDNSNCGPDLVGYAKADYADGTSQSVLINMPTGACGVGFAFYTEGDLFGKCGNLKICYLSAELCNPNPQ